VRQSLAPLTKHPISRFPHERLGDAELVQAVVQGDTEAVGVVWDRYSPLVRTVLRANLGYDSAIEDLLQEVFIIFLRNAREIRTGSALKSFLATVAVRVVLVELRRRRVRRWVTLTPTGEVPEAPTVPQDEEGAAALGALYRLLDHMPPRRRVAFVLRHVEGFELSDVAKSLKVSESTAKREVLKARQAIFARAERSEPSLWHYLSRFEGADNA
jgi:RNA polymerase sigma-70 factor, ECF subfamily